MREEEKEEDQGVHPGINGSGDCERRGREKDGREDWSDRREKMGR